MNRLAGQTIRRSGGPELRLALSLQYRRMLEVEVAVEVAAAATGVAEIDCVAGSAVRVDVELGATTAVTLTWHSTM